MKKKTQSVARQGFTLIELLTVIAIIGILAAIVIPTVGAVQKSAKKAASRSDARQIATSYNTFSTSGSRARNINQGGSGTFAVTSVGEWAEVLAKRADLNIGQIWFITADPQLSSQLNLIPKTVLDTSGNLSTEFDDVSPKSWAVATDLPTAAPASTTPVIWTRGLQSDGFWDATSPWEGDGGHVAFIDGHVTWYDDLAVDPLVNNTGTGDTTSVNIVDALGPVPASGTAPNYVEETP